MEELQQHWQMITSEKDLNMSGSNMGMGNMMDMNNMMEMHRSMINIME